MNHRTAMRFITKDFSNIKFFDDSVGGTDGVEGYYSIEGDSLYIFFNPTDHENDWRKNFTFWKTGLPYRKNKFVRAHTGFINLYEGRKIRSVMHALLEVNKHNVKNVIISGYSLGAAIATLCISDLSLNFPDFNFESCTFGSPRVGNVFFAIDYNRRIKESYRYRYKGDIVTAVPLMRMFYFHVKKKFQLGGIGWWPFSVKSHYLHNYKEELKKLIKSF